MDLKKLGTYLALKRKSLGYTQKYVADMLDVSDKTVSKWERGVNAPDISLLDKLSKTLKISVYDLLAAEDIKEEKDTYEIIGGVIIFYNKLTRKKYIKRLIMIMLILVIFFLFFLNNWLCF